MTNRKKDKLKNYTNKLVTKFKFLNFHKKYKAHFTEENFVTLRLKNLQENSQLVILAIDQE